MGTLLNFNNIIKNNDEAYFEFKKDIPDSASISVFKFLISVVFSHYFEYFCVFCFQIQYYFRSTTHRKKK